MTTKRKVNGPQPKPKKSPAKAKCVTVYLFFLFDINVCILTQFRSSRQWTHEETEILIDEVAKYACLYDTSSADYQNTSLRVDARTAIAKLFHESCSMVHWFK